jgi:ATP-dependent exoDNAse (exonuclease V) alpha subunit
MFVRNDPDQRYVNGTIGIISKLTESVVEVEVETATGKAIVQADKAKWDMIQYKPDPKNPDKISSESIGSYTQIPLKLAWAVTIHKSQVNTFDKVMIDLGWGAFEFGQTYVALSRCKTLEGIILKRPVTPRDIMVDERVVEFYLQNR